MMGSLALIFGLLFFVSLIGGIYKKLIHTEGALSWFVASGVGLVLYISLLFVAANQSIGVGVIAPVPQRHTTVTTPQTKPVTPEKTPTGIPAVTTGPVGSSRPNISSQTSYPSSTGVSSGTTTKSVYGSGASTP